MKSDYLLLPLILLLVCCRSDKSDINRFTNTLLEYYSNIELTNIDYIVIIPNQGCGGCITVAEEFYKKHKMSKNIIFIFTNIISQKILKQKIKVFSHNTFLDTSNVILKSYPKNKNLYPCILKLKDGDIIEIVYQSPTESGFNGLIFK